MAAHGCISCSRYFATPAGLATHKVGKPHKRRLKKLEEEPYTIEESRRAAGMMGVDTAALKKKTEGGTEAAAGMVVEVTA